MNSSRFQRMTGNCETQTLLTGWVLLHNGKPFEWHRDRLPEPHTIVPGVVAVNLDDGTQRIASGGDQKAGAEHWQILFCALVEH